MPVSVDVAPGTPLPGYQIQAVNIYADQHRDGEQNIHEDKVAQKMGFERGFVAGGHSASLITRMLVDYFGKDYFLSGGIAVKFQSPVYDDETVTIGGEVKDRVPEGDGVRVLCDVWLAKPDGTRAVVGEASAVVH